MRGAPSPQPSPHEREKQRPSCGKTAPAFATKSVRERRHAAGASSRRLLYTSRQKAGRNQPRRGARDAKTERTIAAIPPRLVPRFGGLPPWPRKSPTAYLRAAMDCPNGVPGVVLKRGSRRRLFPWPRKPEPRQNLPFDITASVQQPRIIMSGSKKQIPISNLFTAALNAGVEYAIFPRVNCSPRRLARGFAWAWFRSAAAARLGGARRTRPNWPMTGRTAPRPN